MEMLYVSNICNAKKCFVIILENYIQIITIEHVTAFKMLCLVKIKLAITKLAVLMALIQPFPSDKKFCIWII
jgi:hypothetical protein